MLKTKSSKLILTLLLVSVVALGAALSVSLLNLDNPNNVPDSNVAQAITASTSFGTLSNGSKYYYTTTSGGITTITVNTGTARGSQTNPYVISNTSLWLGFAQVITANNATYNKANVYFYLSADLNFGGATIQPVGLNTTGFLGVLVGNKRTISNVKYAQVTDAADSN